MLFMGTIDFSIITPSRNMLQYLPCCAASIEDQVGVEYEHIVIDANSTDGTVEWLRSKERIRFISEPDEGMYDAINKGLKMAQGDILAYLNCDEQYLPGTLAVVRDYFKKHPKTDVLFGNFLVIEQNGAMVCYRKSYTPKLNYLLASYLYTLTCTMFFRRKIIDEHILFDSSYRCIADFLFVVELLKKHYVVKYLNRYLSVFMMTDQNMSLSLQSNEEKKRLAVEKPTLRLGPIRKYIYERLRIVGKFIRGCYFERSNLSYSIYLSDSLEKRKRLITYRPSPFWKH
jgi:glycosyltransferase involved in cell wall biosynthesis